MNKILLFFVVPFFGSRLAPVYAAESGTVEIVVTAAETGETLPCRIHLKDSAGKPVRADPLPFWSDHFVCPGEVRLRLSAGTYHYEIDHGPEFALARGSLVVEAGGEKKEPVKLTRLADLATEGWWSGDLHVHRSLGDIELLMRGEDLHIAPVITWWGNGHEFRNQWATAAPPANLLVRFDTDRFYHFMAGEDEREGGALLYFNLPQPLPLAGATAEFPSPMKFLTLARESKGAWVDIEKPYWWDVPVWLASGMVDSIELANNAMGRDGQYPNEAWGKPRDTHRLPPPLGNALWTQEIYYQALNCGLRLPPSAGSASGVMGNPLGYNRVYAQLDGQLTWDKWWDGLRAGRSFVSNRPLLRVKANGLWPGAVFVAPAGGTVQVKLDAMITSRDPIKQIEILKNGAVERSVPFSDWQKTGSLGELNFTESGWFLVRAIADNRQTFRFASTAPFYIEIGAVQRRVSRASAQFFLDWVRQRKERVKLDDPAQRPEVLRPHEMAEKFWAEKVSHANAP